MLSMQKPMTEKSSRISGLSESGAYAVSAAVSDAGEWTQEGSETNSRVCARYSAAVCSHGLRRLPARAARTEVVPRELLALCPLGDRGRF